MSACFNQATGLVSPASWQNLSEYGLGRWAAVSGLVSALIGIFRGGLFTKQSIFSVNSVDSLEPLSLCFNLRELYMRKNEISDLRQIDFLASLQKLKVLWLDDNPVADDPEYRLRVLRALPHLQTFDNRSEKSIFSMQYIVGLCGMLRVIVTR